MKNFWKWMNKKKYAAIYAGHIWLGGYYYDRKKQVIIGYMLEYLIQKNKSIKVNILGMNDIEKIYSLLEKEVGGI